MRWRRTWWALSVHAVAQRGVQQHIDAAQGRIGAHFAGQLVAVHPRHSDVRNHNFDGLGRVGQAQQFSPCLIAIAQRQARPRRVLSVWGLHSSHPPPAPAPLQLGELVAGQFGRNRQVGERHQFMQSAFDIENLHPPAAPRRSMGSEPEVSPVQQCVASTG